MIIAAQLSSEQLQLAYLCVWLLGVLYGSCNGESSGVSLLSVACVSHELHARKIRGPRI